MLDRYQKMMEVLKPIRLKISTLFVTPRLFWEIMLNNGMKIRLGQEDILTRLQRFVKVYPELFEKSEKKALAVDLRYAHGLAVKWQ